MKCLTEIPFSSLSSALDISQVANLSANCSRGLSRLSLVSDWSRNNKHSIKLIILGVDGCMGFAVVIYIEIGLTFTSRFFMNRNDGSILKVEYLCDYGHKIILRHENNFYAVCDYVECGWRPCFKPTW